MRSSEGPRTACLTVWRRGHFDESIYLFFEILWNLPDISRSPHWALLKLWRVHWGLRSPLSVGFEVRGSGQFLLVHVFYNKCVDLAGLLHSNYRAFRARELLILIISNQSNGINNQSIFQVGLLFVPICLETREIENLSIYHIIFMIVSYQSLSIEFRSEIWSVGKREGHSAQTLISNKWHLIKSI